ncbi:hypothetical protein [Denitrobacterium detoxificans]|uniref:Wobble nucleotide-excising tRNase n=2 Tax=Denitrobacterium detoxificans TaxID=79604 RepID=A0A1H8SD18_9ACTN|nr:hypothetical protein [Denitrobacterium detoxificans]SEO76396.1 hypothetical protein SAMN02910314_01114 [Denitrobacterium detoxificans]
MAKSDYEIELSNCRNIVKSCPLVIKEQALNVFFAKNGTGKTTITRALSYVNLKTPEAFESLYSFDYAETGDEKFKPSVNCSRNVKRLEVFNKEWIDSHCFTESSVQEGAYELYVRDASFEKSERARDKLLMKLRRVLASPDADALRSDLDLIVKGIGKAAPGKVSKASQPFKAFKSGALIGPLPSALKPVVGSMSLSEQAIWLKWHKSHPEPKTTGLCPYCGNDDSAKVIECFDFDDGLEESSVNSWHRLATLFEDHEDIFSRDIVNNSRRIMSPSSAPSQGDLEYLCSLSVDAIAVREAISRMESSLREERCMEAAVLVKELSDSALVLASCKLFRKKVSGKKSLQQSALDGIVRAVHDVCSKHAELESLSKQLLSQAAANIKGRENEINDFLHMCGYRYHVEIRNSISKAEAKVLLVADCPASGSKHEVRDVAAALSYGERNAFSLALFALQATTKSGGIIVFDDPISSFDIDKRFAILYMLFSTKSSVFSKLLLSGSRTILLLTHDYLVVSELAKITKKHFPARRKALWYLSCNSHGELSGSSISDETFRPYVEMLKKRISDSSGKDLIIGLIYLRSLCEMLRKSQFDKRTRWGISFSLLSEIVHGRDTSEVCLRRNWSSVSDGSYSVAICQNLVEKELGISFDYWATVETYHANIPHLLSVYRSTTAPYEKLQLIRMMLKRDPTLNSLGKVMERFADDTCHIGGDYLYQLDPIDFDQVPFYVLDWCDEVAKTASTASSAGANPMP